MTISNVHQAKTNLSKLLDDAAEGNEVLITRGGAITRFKLTPVHPSHTKRATFGAYKGKISFTSDYDDADEQITELFEKSAGDE